MFHWTLLVAVVAVTSGVTSGSKATCEGRPNEHYEQCPTCTVQKCTEVGFPIACPDQSSDSTCPKKPACVCDNGYVRNKKGVCVPKKDCPSCGGDPNAVSGCGICRPTCQNNGVRPKICPRICPPNNCDCRPGYWYDEDTKKCVLPKDCKSCNGDPNAKPGCGVNCGRLCSNYNKGPVACPAICYEGGCDCKKGYVLDENTKKCVLPKKCTPVCGANEEYVQCVGAGCFAGRNCSDIVNGQDPPTLCVDVLPEYCVAGCQCKNGYLRNSNGACVAKEECPVTDQCGKNEIYDKCVTPCPPRKCGINDAAVLCAPTDPADCKAGCRCADGFYRNYKGECVTFENCPLGCNGDLNARPGCGVNCGRRCSNYNKEPVSCIDRCYENACDCNEGYVFDDNTNKCVLPQECTPVCNANEEYTSCVEGGCFDARNCSEIVGGQKPPIKCVKPIKCTAGCQCKEGYLRNCNGVCVPRDECSHNEQCPSNEVYDACPNPCPPQLCSVDERVIRCAAPPQLGDPECKAGCRCIDGYKRNDQGLCIPKEQCPPICNGVNEEYNSCPVTCPPNTCEGIRSKKPCPIRPAVCIGACTCKPGFYRNKIGECISLEQCKKCTGPHEYYSCGGACDNVCSNLSQQNQTSCPIINIKCNEMCYCEDGYARDDNGICVPFASCSKCNGVNEEYNSCPVTCPPNTCESLWSKKPCPIRPAVCIGACTCKPGFYRNKIGECISSEQCKKCTGPHEYYSCGGACDNVCSNLSEQNQTSCPIINIKCNEMCYCEDGYARDDNGICVPFASCSKCNGINEEYNSCPVTCPPNTCESLWSKKPCPIRPAVCIGACTCKSGFYKNKIGACISSEQCKKCTGPHEYYSCGGACDNVCSNLSEQNQTSCPIINIKCNEMCYCEEGYARDDNGICVPFASCPAKGACTPISKHSTPSSGNNDDAVESFSAGINSFTFKFLQQVLKTKSGENIFMSPFSVMTPLSELALYAESNTLKELLSSLHLSSKDQIRQAFRTILEATQGGDGVTFSKAVKVYVNNLYPISESFRDDTQNVFNGTAENVDCSDSAGTADYINKWVESQTNNRITDLISPDMIDPMSRLILVSAIFFQAKWKTEFNKGNTKLADFYTSDKKTTQVSMMNIETKLEYTQSDELKAQVVRIPYVNSNFSFVIVLPLDKDGFADTAANCNADTMKATLSKLYTTKVNLFLPSMELNTSLELVDILKALGLIDIFDPAKADFQGILKSPESLSVSAAIQKAFVKVNEEGSEAAAATAIGVSATSAVINPPPTPVVKCDHPFFFAIYANNVPFFIGAYQSNK